MRRLIPLIAITFLISAACVRADGGRGVRASEVVQDRKDKVESALEGVIGVDFVTPSEEGLVQVEVHGVAAADLIARFVGDTLFVPYILLSDFLRIPNSVSRDGRTITGEFPKGEPFVIDRTTATAYYRGDSVGYPPASVRSMSGEIFIEHKLFAKILGLVMRFDVMRLKLVIDPNDKLPVVEWAKTSNRLAMMQNSEHGTRDVLLAPIDRHLLGNPVVDWNLSSTYGNGRASGALTLRGGGELLYGSLEVNATTAVVTGGAPSTNVSNWNWRFPIPELSAIRQIVVGTMPIRRNSYLGIELTNVPLAPRKQFGAYDLSGYTQPGWMVEMYKGNSLVDMVQADSNGFYRFQVPVGYGTTDRMLRQIGPYGEVVTEERRLQLNPDMIPPGEVQYTSTFGLGNGGLSNLTDGPFALEGRLDAGLTQFMSMGLEGFTRGPTLGSATLDSVHATAVANLWLGGTTSLSLRHQFGTNLDAGELLWVMPSNNTLRLIIDSASIPDRTFIASASGSQYLGRFSVSAAGRYRHQLDAKSLELEPTVSGYVPGVSFSLGAAMTLPIGSSTNAAGSGGEIGDSLATVDHRTLAATTQIIATPFPWLVLTAQGRYDVVNRTIQTLRLSSYTRVSDAIGLNLNYSLPEGDLTRSTLQLQLGLTLDFTRATVTGSYSDGEFSTASIAQGSLLASRAGLRMLPDGSVGQAALIFTAFHDRNFNGVRDDGEEELDPPSVYLNMDGVNSSAEDGKFFQLPPNRQCVVEVDRWTHADEGLFPGSQHYVVYTAPSSQRIIEIPFCEGFDVTGRCLFQSDDTNSVASNSVYLNGLRVQLIGADGMSTYDGEVYSDGSIYVPAVAAGHYTVRFDGSQLHSRRLRLIDAPQQVLLTKENSSLPQVLLGPDPDSIPSDDASGS